MLDPGPTLAPDADQNLHLNRISLQMIPVQIKVWEGLF